MPRSLAKPAALVLERPHKDWTWKQDVAFGHRLVTTADNICWAIGRWILYMEGKYGEKYAQAVTEIGLHPHTAQNYASVCERFPPSRQREALSFGHHEAVAYLEPAKQDYWLDRAEKERMTRAQLREQLGKGRKALEIPHPPHRCKQCGIIWEDGG